MLNQSKYLNIFYFFHLHEEYTIHKSGLQENRDTFMENENENVRLEIMLS